MNKISEHNSFTGLALILVLELLNGASDIFPEINYFYHVPCAETHRVNNNIVHYFCLLLVKIGFYGVGYWPNDHEISNIRPCLAI